MTNESLLQLRDQRKSFDNQAPLYDEFAHAQHIAARNLASVLRAYQNEICGKTIVEYGAGTGMITEHLIRLFPSSTIHATDLSPNMIASIKEKYDGRGNIHFDVFDANGAFDRISTTSVVVSGFTLQWLDDPVASVSSWLSAMAKPGHIFLTWPGEGSFPEWRRAATIAGVAFTGNVLPGADIIDTIAAMTGADTAYHSVDLVSIDYPNAIEFFRGIRNIGASDERQTVEGRRNLLRLMRVWDGLADGYITTTYHVHTAVLTTNSKSQQP